MSSPPNALDAYRTYSYHHILIATDGTGTAEALSKETELTRFDHPDVRFFPQDHKDGGKYIVLINGMSDAQFVVQSAKWSTVPIPTMGPGTASTVTSVQTMAVDGEIEILEPQGINFFNVLANATRLMHIDPSLVTFVLKTIFVGHRDDGSVNIISTVKPLLFMMVDMTANIEVSGSTYTMSIVGIVNGAAKLPHVNSIVNGLTLNVEDTLENTFNKLAGKISDISDKMWDVLTRPAGNCGVKLSADKFSQVEYKFELDDWYKNKKCGNHYDDKFKDTTGQGGYVANLGDMSSIENIITSIMMTSKDVVEASKGQLPDNRYMFKISSDIKTSAGDKETGKGAFTVTYYIHRYKASIVKAEEFQTFMPPKDTGITFDYIFTGKNIDILDLDVKMEYGLMFFQVMAAQGTSPTSTLQLLRQYNPDTFVKGSGAANVFGDTGKDKKQVRRPLFLGTTLNHPLFRDTKSISSSASFNSMLTRHAAVENLGVQVKIRGNPQLLEDTTQLPSDLNTVLKLVDKPQVIEPPQGDAELVSKLRNIMPTIHRTPAYVKIKIWSPQTWTNTGERTAKQIAENYEGDYAQNLWYDGWYYVIQIDNEFEDGTFTQTMELLSLPTEISEEDIDEDCHQRVIDEMLGSSTTANTGAETSSGTSSNTGAETPDGNIVTVGSGINIPKSDSKGAGHSRDNSTANDAKNAVQVKFKAAEK